MFVDVVNVGEEKEGAKDRSLGDPGEDRGGVVSCPIFRIVFMFFYIYVE